MIYALVFAALLAWVAALYRLRVSLKAESTLWSWSFTLAVLFLAIGVSIFPLSKTINDVTSTPNLAALLMHVFVGIALGSVLVFLKTLRYDHVPLTRIAGILSGTFVAIALMVCSWIMAPFHSQEIKDLALVPPTFSTAVYFGTWYLFVTAGLAVTARWCLQELREPQPAAIRVGLRFIGASTSLGALTFAVAGLRIVLRWATSDPWSGISIFVQAATAVAITGIALGTVIFVVGPQIAATHRARRLNTDLQPLVDRVSELFPGVTLRSGAIRSEEARLQRSKTEILDALRLLHVKDSEGRDPHQIIADALDRPRLNESLVSATQLMPPVATEEEEEEWLRSLAREYTRISRFGSTENSYR